MVRLRHQLLSTWQSLLHSAKNDARRCLSDHLHSDQLQHVSQFQALAALLLGLNLPKKVASRACKNAIYEKNRQRKLEELRKLDA